MLPEDLEPVSAPQPWVTLLPALDPTIMGWMQRGWFLGEHGPALFDRSGNAGPTVWCDGRVVGGWAQRPEGDVVFRLFEDIGAETSRSVEEAAARLTAWLGPLRVVPRFRTPLERELSGNEPRASGSNPRSLGVAKSAPGRTSESTGRVPPR